MDKYGRIIGMSDRFNNRIEFEYYPTSSGGPQKLKAIVRDIANLPDDHTAILFSRPDSNASLTITLPNKSQTELNYSDTSQVFTIKQAGLAKFSIRYNQENNKATSISSIRYPTGLIKEFQYQDLKGLQVVQVEKNMNSNGKSVISPIYYDFNPAGNNGHSFLGNCQNSDKKDCLLEKTSNDIYDYEVSVEQGNKVTLYDYNHAHLLIHETIYDYSGGNKEKLQQDNYLYMGQGDNPSIIGANGGTNANYQMPRWQQAVYFNPKTGLSRAQAVSKQYNDFGQLTEETAPNGAVTIYHYDDPAEQPNPADQHHYGLLLSKTTTTQDGAISQEDNSLSADGKTVHISDIKQGGVKDNELALEKTLTSVYNTNGEPETVTTAAGKQTNTVSYEYHYEHRDGEIIKKITEKNRLHGGTTLFINEATGKTVEEEIETDSGKMGDPVFFHYDDLGRIKEIKNADGTRQSYQYDNDNQTLTVTSSTGLIMRYDFNVFGKVTDSYDNINFVHGAYLSSPSMLLESIDYNKDGEPEAVTRYNDNKAINTVNYHYDVLGRKESEVNSSGYGQQFIYDDAAHSVTTNRLINQREEGDANFSTTESYNDFDHLTDKKIINLDNDAIRHDSYQYNGFQAVASEALANGDTVTNHYNDLHQLETSTLAQQVDGKTINLATNYRYDPLGKQQQELLSQQGLAHNDNYNGDIYHYNSLGEMTKQTNSEGNNVVGTTYYPDGKVKTQTLINGNTIHLFYNNRGQRSAMCYSLPGKAISSCADKGAHNPVAWIYYQKGHLTGLLKSISPYPDSDGVWDKGIIAKPIEYRYYDDRQLKSISYPNADDDQYHAIEYSYNSAGHIATVTDFHGDVTHYTYVIAGGKWQVQAAQLDGANGELANVSYAYYPSGKLKTIVKSHSGDSVTTQLRYNGFGEVESITQTNHDNKIINQLTYRYYPSGFVKTKTSGSELFPDNDHNSISTYTYRLGRATVTTSSGGKLIKSEDFQHDADSNLVALIAGEQKQFFHFNLDNQLTTDNTINSVFAYDDLGNLIQDDEANRYHYNGSNELIKTELAGSKSDITYHYYLNGLRASQSQAGVTLHYFYDGNGELISTESGKQWVSYLFGKNRAARVVDGKVYFYLYDRHGSVINYINKNDDHAYAYTPYGETVDHKDTTELSLTDNPFKYAGQYQDSNSGLYYLYARYYSPRLKVFLGRDSVNEENRYAYTAGNPVNFLDINGHSWFSDNAWWISIAVFTVVSVVVPVAGIVAAGYLGVSIGMVATASAYGVGAALGSMAGEAVTRAANNETYFTPSLAANAGIAAAAGFAGSYIGAGTGMIAKAAKVSEARAAYVGTFFDGFAYSASSTALTAAANGEEFLSSSTATSVLTGSLVPLATKGLGAKLGPKISSKVDSLKGYLKAKKASVSNKIVDRKNRFVQSISFGTNVSENMIEMGGMVSNQLASVDVSR